MSDRRWSIGLGDESYADATSFQKKIWSLKLRASNISYHHQGRAAENVLFHV